MCMLSTLCSHGMFDHMGVPGHIHTTWRFVTAIFAVTRALLASRFLLYVVCTVAEFNSENYEFVCVALSSTSAYHTTMNFAWTCLPAWCVSTFCSDLMS